MTRSPLLIICANTSCAKRLQINNPEKFGNGVKCPSCGYLNWLPGQSEKEEEEDEPTRIGTAFQAPVLPDVPGWLIIKEEQAEMKTYVLHVGNNTIGRKSSQNPPDHSIDTGDNRISRPHCTIEVKINRLGILDFLLRDGAMLPEGVEKFSVNGTYLNGNSARLLEQDRIYLKDADVIQVGLTKLVLKTGYKSGTLEEALEVVKGMAYTKTVRE